MKTRVQLSMVVSSGTVRAQLRNALQTDLGTKQLFDGAILSLQALEGHRVVASLRFESATEAAAFYAQLAARLSEARVRPGTLISIHNCAHDEPESEWFNCRTDPRAAYQEQVK